MDLRSSQMTHFEKCGSGAKTGGGIKGATPSHSFMKIHEKFIARGMSSTETPVLTDPSGLDMNLYGVPPLGGSPFR